MRDGNISHEAARWIVDHARWEHDVDPDGKPIKWLLWFVLTCLWAGIAYGVLS